MPRAFIDTSVIANWIIISKKIKDSGKEPDVFLESLEKYKLKKPINSYKFFTKIQDNQIQKDTFIISDIVLAELFKVMSDQQRIDVLYNSGIPIKFWNSRFVLEENERIKANSAILNFMAEFVTQEKITSLLNPEYNLNHLSELIIEHRVDSTDAILIAIAVKDKCKYFITVDERLKDRVKTFKGLKVIFPDTYISENRL